jgi:hypothetical protein
MACFLRVRALCEAEPIWPGLGLDFKRSGAARFASPL